MAGGVLLTKYLNFNPHSRVGSDHMLPLCDALYRIFQSTLPRGE